MHSKTKFKRTKTICNIKLFAMRIFFANFVPIMHTMDFNQLIKESFREELQLFDTYLRKSVANDNPRISKVVNHIFAANGKRLRPSLVFLSAKACGKITPETYHGAVTVELLHTASLVHDDVIDKSELRRNRPSANAAFDNTHAVLVGDYLLSSAALEGFKMDDTDIAEMIAQLSKSLAEGEINQYVIASEMIIDENEYFDVIDKKTASLMRACTIIGAKTANASEKTVELFGQLGQLLGIAFQLKDDIFDYFSDDVGKPIGNDIREGKITLPLIYALQNAPESESKQMLEIIHARDFSTDNIQKLFAFTKANGGIEYTYSKIDSCIADAEKIVAMCEIDADKKQMLRILLLYLRDRKY